MPRARKFPALLAAIVSAGLLTPRAYAQETAAGGGMFELPVPGGLQAALDAIGDAGAVERSHFLLDLIRYLHHTPSGKGGPSAALQSITHHLDGMANARSGAGTGDTVPLPLNPDLWIQVVFDGQASLDTLASAILRSRAASLLYHGLLSLDAPTRAWLADRPHLIRKIADTAPAAFATAAPGLRVEGGTIVVPGGAAAAPAWEALVGPPVSDAEGFVLAVLGHPNGRLAYFLSAMSQLTRPQLAVALNLEPTGSSTPAASARRLFTIFERLGWDWRVEDRTFWRPVLDPSLLVAELPADEEGRPRLEGSREFWRLVLTSAAGGGRKRPRAEDEARAAAVGPPVDFLWLAEQVFSKDATGFDRRYELVLFASRIVRGVTPATAADALDAVRTAAAYPALRAALDRAGIDDARTFAVAGRRAARLEEIRDRTRARRALAQFQGSLAVITHAAARGTLTKASAAEAVRSLAAVEPAPRGDYQGRLVTWLDAQFGPPSRGVPGDRRQEPERTAESQGPLDAALRLAVAGRAPREPLFVEWEGTRYHVDLAHAETVRLTQLLGSDAPSYASSALAIVRLAGTLEEPALRADTLRGAADALDGIAQHVGWTEKRPDAVAALRRHAQRGDVGGAATLAADLLILADDLLARALGELVYAAALGQPDRTPITAVEGARRHDFGTGSGNWRRHAAWQLPLERVDPMHGWKVTGSLLGLDVRLASFALVAWSSKPPPRRPTLNEQDRRIFIETVALLESALLSDGDRDTIAEGLRQGRARLAAVGGPADVLALADGIRLSPSRRSLLPWVVAHDPENLPRFLSPSELLWLGLDALPLGERLHGWGAPGRPRLGCHCLQLLDRRPWETFAGRWNSGIIASAFPDLNLRLTELLAELRMPASLLGPVLQSAMLDFVNTVVSRDHDDWRGLVAFVHALRIDDVEQYLALLTTDGPLVPVGEAPTAAAGLHADEPETP